MTRRKTAHKPVVKKSNSARGKKRQSPPPKRQKAPSHFVGRAGSPILDKYPPKAMDAPVGGVAFTKPAAASTVPPPPPSPRTVAAPVSLSQTSNPPPSQGVQPGPPKLLISLEKPFDIDEFSQLLGQTQIRVTVPSESLVEVLRRTCDFMGFGIYVYSIRVRPGPEELLKTFIVELERVDFSPQARDWAPFQDRGRADSPFGPGGTR